MSEKKSYKEKLKDPRWQKKRLVIMERDRFQCMSCGDDKQTLNVHHCEYLGGNDPWDYPDNLLITLCEECHIREHSTIISGEISDYVNEIKGHGILISDVSNLFEAIVEEKYNREQILNLIDSIYSFDVPKELNVFAKIKVLVRSLEK